jgi:hypothetical protein
MPKLYELSQNYNNLLDLLDNPDIPGEMITEALNTVNEDIEEKAENICKLIKSMEADATGYKEEESRLQNRRKTIENKVKGLKDYLDGAMKATGKEKIKGKLFTVAYQKNPPSVDITDIGILPKEYFCEPVEPAPDKKHIMEDLKAGKEIPGATIKQGMSLRIRKGECESGKI